MSTQIEPITEVTPSQETASTRPNLRVFISSPSDVRPERLNAKRLVEKLDREFGHYFRVEPVLWEREPLKATEHFQASITPPHETDIVVVILWSRLGVPLPPEEKFLGAITGRQVTGTEWEFEDAFASYQVRQHPDLLFYLKTAEIRGSFEDEAVVLQQLEQKKRVQDFIQRWFFDSETQTFKLAYSTFATSTELEETLETHLRGLLEKRLNLAEGEFVQSGIRWHQGSPYRGLESFGLEHAPVFFGRTRARNELRELLARQSAGGCAFILVFGASGSGKSSLVKAGLLPDLKLPGMIGQVALCRHAVLRPADAQGDLLGYLAAALLGDTALPELTGLQYDRAGLTELLREAPNQMKQALRQGLTLAAKAERLTERAEARLVLVIDQLEELFTLDILTSEDRAAFVAALEALARSGLVWVVATMRSDFFDRLDGLPALARLSAGEARYLLTLPDTAEIGQIVRQPAREAGLYFEFDRTRGLGLDDELCQAAAQAPSALPLLEFTLDQLWQRRTGRGELAFAAYQELGGLEGALGRRAEEEFSNLPAEVQAVLPQVLRALATAGQGVRAAVTARTASLSAFASGSPQRQLVETFLAPQARLLVVDGDDAGARVRVAHEALLTHWERARDQLSLDRTDLQTRARLEQAASLWQTATGAGRASRLLPTGLPLAEAEDLLLRRRDELDSTAIAYIEASTAAAQAQAKRSRRRLQVWVAGLAVLFVLALIGGTFAYIQMQTAKAALAESEREQLRAQSAELRGMALRLDGLIAAVPDDPVFRDELAGLEAERRSLAERLARTTRLHQAKLAEQIGFRGDYDFLMKWEGNAGSVRLGGRSVMIDPATYLASEKPEEIRKRYEFILTPDELEALVAVTGKNGAEAEEAYAANPVLARIRIKPEDVARLVPEVTERFWKQLLTSHPGLASPDTPAAVQTALLSFVMNMGFGSKQLRALTPLIDGRKWLELADAIQAINAGTPNAQISINLKRRRAEEADLIRKAVGAAQPAPGSVP